MASNRLHGFHGVPRELSNPQLSDSEQSRYNSLTVSVREMPLQLTPPDLWTIAGCAGQSECAPQCRSCDSRSVQETESRSQIEPTPGIPTSSVLVELQIVKLSCHPALKRAVTNALVICKPSGQWAVWTGV